MSYYRIYKPTEEKVEELRKKTRKEGFFGYANKSKIELEIYVMKDHSQDKISDVIKDIYYYLAGLDYEATSNSYKYSVDQYDTEEDKTVWFSGWKYAQNEADYTRNDVYDYVVERLSMLAMVVNTPDYFDNSEKYHEKLTEVSEIIDYFSEAIQEITDFEIMDFLKEFEVKDEEEVNPVDEEL